MCYVISTANSNTSDYNQELNSEFDHEISIEYIAAQSVVKPGDVAFQNVRGADDGVDNDEDDDDDHDDAGRRDSAVRSRDKCVEFNLRPRSLQTTLERMNNSSEDDECSSTRYNLIR
jgi:hypothetical protein